LSTTGLVGCYCTGQATECCTSGINSGRGSYGAVQCVRLDVPAPETIPHLEQQKARGRAAFCCTDHRPETQGRAGIFRKIDGRKTASSRIASGHEHTGCSTRLRACRSVRCGCGEVVKHSCYFPATIQLALSAEVSAEPIGEEAPTCASIRAADGPCRALTDLSVSDLPGAVGP
jgi:hypothetical protein